MIKNILTKKIVWLLLIAIVAHGFMLFLDGISWDEHTIFSHLSFNEFGVLISWVRGLGFIAGLPAYLGISIKLLFGNNFIFGYRLVAFLSIYLSSVLIYLIMTRSKVLGENESFLLLLFLWFIRLCKLLIMVRSCIICFVILFFGWQFMLP